MSEEDWEAFFAALEELVNAGGSWSAKREAVEAEAERRGAGTALEEFLAWWDDEQAHA